MTANMFRQPWKNSDIILLVQDVEFHVHRPILVMQSPVFEIMLNGAFREAKQDKIELEGEDPKEIMDFLKLLYPSEMFKYPLHSQNVLAMLKLADKYQIDAVLKQCFSYTIITKDNALKILPFAMKYDKKVRKKCINVAQTKIATTVLKQSLKDELFDDEIVLEIFIGKCQAQEKALKEAKKAVVQCKETVLYGHSMKWDSNDSLISNEDEREEVASLIGHLEGNMAT